MESLLKRSDNHSGVLMELKCLKNVLFAHFFIIFYDYFSTPAFQTGACGMPGDGKTTTSTQRYSKHD